MNKNARPNGFEIWQTRNAAGQLRWYAGLNSGGNRVWSVEPDGYLRRSSAEKAIATARNSRSVPLTESHGPLGK